MCFPLSANPNLIVRTIKFVDSSSGIGETDRRHFQMADYFLSQENVCVRIFFSFANLNNYASKATDNS